MSLPRFGRTLLRSLQSFLKPSVQSTGTINGRISEASSSIKQLVKSYQNVSRYNFAAKAKREALNRFLYSSRRRLPLYAFVGFCMKDSSECESNQPDLSLLFRAFQGGFLHNFKSEESDTQYPSKIEEYEIHSRLGKPSSYGAVYHATHQNENVAVKMMFNIDPAPDASAAGTIMKGFSKEYSLLKSTDKESGSTLPKHANIINILNVFVDDTKMMPDSMSMYPLMLPRKFVPDGCGRRKTMFMIMPKYPYSLQSYLAEYKNLPFEKRLYLFCQLLEAVAHLEKNKVCHRDLKADNILVDTSHFYPRLVLADFGSSFNGSQTGMKLFYQTEDLSKGGNPALLAPEIYDAHPGYDTILDYSKADVWAAGSIAYQIFGKENPLYSNKSRDIPSLRSGCYVLDLVVEYIMQEVPGNRISASMASNILTLLFYDFKEVWFLPKNTISEEQIHLWLLEMSFQCHRPFEIFEKDLNLFKTFVARTNPNEILDSIEKCQKLMSAG